MIHRVIAYLMSLWPRKKGPAVYHEPMPWKDEYWENRP